MSIMCDHLSFSRAGKPFFPLICDDPKCSDYEDFDAVTIFVNCKLASDLKWEEEKAKAQSLVSQGLLIFWDLDFGLDQKPFVLSSYLLAMQTFIQKLYLPFTRDTLGVNLYRGSVALKIQGNFDFEGWLEDYPLLPFPEKFYAAKILSEILHRLAAVLPDEALPFALFDASEPMALFAQLLSREHLSHIFIGVKGEQISLGVLHAEDGKLRAYFEAVKTGIVLPLTAYCTEKSLEEAETCLKEMQKVRVVYESHLTESWDELDRLILFSNFISPQGKRKVIGFQAAGGEICEI